MEKRTQIFQKKTVYQSLSFAVGRFPLPAGAKLLQPHNFPFVSQNRLDPRNVLLERNSAPNEQTKTKLIINQQKIMN